MGIFGFFGGSRGGKAKEDAPAAQTIDEVDWGAMSPVQGLPALAEKLALSEATWGFGPSLPSKLEVMRGVLQGVDAEDDLFKALALDPDANPREIRDYEELSEFGKSVVMLIFGVGSLAGFVAGNQGSALGNTVAGEAAELRSVMLVDKAYEAWGERALIAACVEMFLPMLSPKIDALPRPAETPEKTRRALEDFSALARHIRDMFYDHYRPRRMPHMSLRDPVDKTSLSMADMEHRAMAQAGLFAASRQRP